MLTTTILTSSAHYIIRYTKPKFTTFKYLFKNFLLKLPRTVSVLWYYKSQ